MCLAIPGKVIKIEKTNTGETATIDYNGLKKKANISLINPQIGDYVLVHAGFAIEIIDKEKAERSISTWNENH